MSGPQLKQQRLAAGVTSSDLAHRMQVGRPRVSQIEALANVNEDTSSRYLAALIALAPERTR